MKRFVRQLFGIQEKPARLAPHRRRNKISSRIETCEERKMCAADCTIKFDSDSGTVAINGSEQRDSANVSWSITSVGTFVTFDLTCNYNTPNQLHKTLRLNAAQIKKIEFNGYGGDDQFSNQTGIRSIADGGKGADTLIGGSSQDEFLGGAGSDYLRGMGGTDFLHGHNIVDPDDAARDIIYGGSGGDYMVGGMGDDLLCGEEDIDYLFGDDGNDQLYGGSEQDYLAGGLGNDILYGESGDDTLVGDAGDDFLYGGDNNDTLRGGHGRDELYGEAGNDELDGNHRSAGIKSDRQADKLVGGSGRDKFLLAYWWETDRSGKKRKVYEDQADNGLFDLRSELEVPAPRPYHNYSVFR